MHLDSARLAVRSIPMKPSTPLPPAAVEAETRAWVARLVIGLNLCPFAKAVQARNQIRYVVCAARDEATLLVTLLDELKALTHADPQRVDTTLLIHPFVLSDFLDFNQFLGVADAAIARSQDCSNHSQRPSRRNSASMISAMRWRWRVSFTA